VFNICIKYEVPNFNHSKNFDGVPETNIFIDVICTALRESPDT